MAKKVDKLAAEIRDLPPGKGDRLLFQEAGEGSQG